MLFGVSVTSSSMIFRDKVALVTGGGRGIGRAICLDLAAQGATLAVLDLDALWAEETCRLIGAAGGNAVHWGCDITDYEAVDRAVDEIVLRHGTIDVLANNAGGGSGAEGFLNASPKNVVDVVTLNLTGHIWVTQTVVRKAMSPQRYGRIVFTASEAGVLGSAKSPIYGAAKGGIVALTKSLAKALAHLGVTVNCVAPGPTETEPLKAAMLADPEWAQMRIDTMPMGRLATAEEIAAAVSFLASDAASYITGMTLGVDGGATRAP